MIYFKYSDVSANLKLLIYLPPPTTLSDRRYF